MSVVVIGLNHRTMPLDQFERMAIGEPQLPKALAMVRGTDHVAETVVLSTCNRTEVYAVAEKFHGAYSDIRDFLAQMADVAPEEFSDHLYVHYDEGAVRHLFSVVCGLDSVVVGEHEILGQTKDAWELAQDESAAGPVLNMLFRHAVETGKRARTETSIGRHIASASQAAVAMAAERLGTLEGRSVLVVGAGEMGEGMAVTLARSGVREVLVANRTRARADALAERVGGRAVGLDAIPDAVRNVDVLLTSTGATELIVDHAEFAPLVQERDDRPLLIVDIAVPRDVDRAIGDLAGVTLLDMDDLRRFAEAGMRARRREVVDVQSIIEEELERYRSSTSARTVSPLIAKLHEGAEWIRRSELERYAARLEGLDPRQRESVEALTRGIVAKLLHQPTVALKDTAGSARGERLADALRDVFGLREEGDGPAPLGSTPLSELGEEIPPGSVPPIAAPPNAR
ncbi:MAG TPA: glutamyl-tRNA reductase [Acidimicrobiales bacterium]|nr:glutamyl-tRNA reductase [Acidimicrobiales bacterium]